MNEESQKIIDESNENIDEQDLADLNLTKICQEMK